MAFGKPQFQYRDIGDTVVKEIAALVSRGESFVVLGPQGAGKRYLFELLERRWERECNAFYNVSFGTSEEMPADCYFGTNSITDERLATEILTKACHLDESVSNLIEWDAAMRERWEADKVPHLLLATNVDGMSKDLGRQFLGLLRGLVQDRVLIAGVTGESNLVDLVHGPTSEFNCTHQFVVHAHDEAHFELMLRRWMQIATLVWPEVESEKQKTLNKLYRLTGGDIVLLRLVMFCISERRIHHGKDPGSEPFELGVAQIPNDLANTFLVPVGGVVPFRRAVRCVEADERSWAQLRHLINGVSCYVQDDVPTSLELAGLARRDSKLQLRWASSYAEVFAKRFFTPTRLGDYHAASGQFKEAFLLYEQEHNRQLCRPLNDDDQLWFSRVVETAAGDFSRAASSKGQTNSEGYLMYMLRKAALLLLGVSEVTIYDANGREWIQANEAGDKLSCPPEELRSVLPLKKGTKLEDDNGRWIITQVPQGNRSAAILADQLVVLGSKEGAEMPKIRKRLVKRLLTAYRDAREHVLLVKSLNHRLTVRAEVLKVTEDILAKLGNESWRTPEILNHVGKRWVGPQLGIERIIFFLHSKSDAGEIKFQLAYDTRPNGGEKDNAQDIAARTEHFAKFLKHGTEEPLDLEQVRKETWCQALSITRPTTLFKMGIGGIMVVESNASDSLSGDLTEALSAAAERIASALLLDQKFGLLQGSLNSMTSPTLILDSRYRVRMMNRVAIDKLGLNPGLNSRAGWQDKPETLEELGCKLQVATKLRSSLTDEHSIQYFDTLTSDMPGRWLSDTHQLRGWDNKPDGWFLHIRDRALILSSFDLMKMIEGATDVHEAMMRIAEGFRDVRLASDVKIRLFVRDPFNDQVLVSHFSHGSCPEEAASFNRGDYKLYADQDVQGWSALAKGEPLVFRWRPNDPEGIARTQRGLVYRSVRTTKWSDKFGKTDGYFWIDFPLIASGRKYGKLTLQFTSGDGEKLTPEIEAMLRGLSFVIGSLMERLQKDVELKSQMKEAAEHALAQTAHTLVAKLAGISSYVGRYRLRAERGSADTHDISDQFEDYYRTLVASLRRIKDRIGPIKLSPTKCDLATIIDFTLNESLGEHNWSWGNGSKPVLLGNWDKIHMGNVFAELAQNSLDFAAPGRPLHVTVEALAGAESSNQLTIAFADNGMGVADEHKSDIFDALVSHRELVGSVSHGVGLNYVARVVDALGGKCVETGVAGSGARIEISMPTPIFH